MIVLAIGSILQAKPLRGKRGALNAREICYLGRGVTLLQPTDPRVPK